MFELLFNCIDTEFFKIPITEHKSHYVLFEISSVHHKYRGKDNCDTFSTFLHVDDEKIFKKNRDVLALTGINSQYLSCAPTFVSVYESVFFRKPTDYFVFWGKKDIMLLNSYLSKIHNCSFYLAEKNCIDLQEEYSILFDEDILSLDQACIDNNISRLGRHNSCDDAIATANVLSAVISKIQKDSRANIRSNLCLILNYLDICQKNMVNNNYKTVSFNDKLILL